MRTPETAEGGGGEHLGFYVRKWRLVRLRLLSRVSRERRVLFFVRAWPTIFYNNTKVSFLGFVGG